MVYSGKGIMRKLFSHTPNFGLMNKAKACKGVGQKGSLGITSHAPGNVGKCEGMNPHPPKVGAHLRIGVPMGSRIFSDQL